MSDYQPLSGERGENLELGMFILPAYKTVGIGLGWMRLKALVKGPRSCESTMKGFGGHLVVLRSV